MTYVTYELDSVHILLLARILDTSTPMFLTEALGYEIELIDV